MRKSERRTATKVADHVPTFHTNVPGVVGKLGEGLNLRECVITRLRHRACDGEGPFVEIHSGVVDIVAINGKLTGGSEVRVSKRRR